MTGASRPLDTAGLAASTLLKTNAGNFIDMRIYSHLVEDNFVYPVHSSRISCRFSTFSIQSDMLSINDWSFATLAKMEEVALQP